MMAKCKPTYYLIDVTHVQFMQSHLTRKRWESGAQPRYRWYDVSYMIQCKLRGPQVFTVEAQQLTQGEESSASMILVRA